MSISSKIIVFMLSVWAKMVLIASITREISPPDAIFASGLGVSEMLVEIKNSTLSAPFALKSQGFTSISKRTFGISSFSSSALKISPSSAAIFFLEIVNFSLIAVISRNKALFSASSR